MQQIGYLLDIKTRRGLLLMKIDVLIIGAAIWWGRFLRYFYLWYSILTTYYADGSYLLRLSIVPLVGMSLFNLGLIADTTTKVAKFLPKTIQNTDPEELREASAIVLASSTVDSFRGLSAADGSWAKLRGAYAMGALKKKKGE